MSDGPYGASFLHYLPDHPVRSEADKPEEAATMAEIPQEEPRFSTARGPGHEPSRQAGIVISKTTGPNGPEPSFDQLKRVFFDEVSTVEGENHFWIGGPVSRTRSRKVPRCRVSDGMGGTREANHCRISEPNAGFYGFLNPDDVVYVLK